MKYLVMNFNIEFSLKHVTALLPFMGMEVIAGRGPRRIDTKDEFKRDVETL